MLTEVYAEAADRLNRYMSNSRIQDELNATLHNYGEVTTDYDGWLEGCEKFMDDNHNVLKEWM